MEKSSVFLVFIGFFLNQAYAAPPHSFPEAKRVVCQLFSKHPKTLYCGCRYNAAHEINLSSCHMSTANEKKRAHIVEIEHIVAADTLGHQLSCWKTAICEHHGKHYKGRKCCEKSNYQFREMESELYNLWPAVGLVNIARSNFSYGVVASDDKFYGCDFKINKASKEVEPANKVKGIVARATLFISDKYDIPLAENKRQLYLSWNKAFPPSKWEKEWALKVASIEGYSNPYILVE
jgi:deoxyribonuclease-1